MSTTALLVLSNGTVFVGEAWGATGVSVGDVAFTTEMIGYQRPMTDPVNSGKILVFTTPHVGISGFDAEVSSELTPAGVVVRDPARPATWTDRRELVDELAAQGVVGIAGVDTRAITRLIRGASDMRAFIVSGPALPVPAERFRGSARRPLDLGTLVEEFHLDERTGIDGASTFDRFVDSMTAGADPSEGESH